ELEQRAKAMGATNPEPQSKSEAINADMFKVVADRLIAESGVTPLLHAVAIDTVMEGDALQGIIVHSKSGRGAILAKRIIDASGPGHDAQYAAAPERSPGKRRLRRERVTVQIKADNKNRSHNTLAENRKK